MHLLSVFSLRNRALIALVTLVIAAFGGVALTLLKTELFPSLTLPQVTVTASYPGASAAVVENDVSTPIEGALQGIEGLDNTSSTSTNGFSFVTAEFSYGTDLIYAEQKVQLAVNRLQNRLPEGVTPTVSTFSFSDFPVIVLAVTSDLGPDELTNRLETIAVPELQALDGVREATVSGGAGQRVTITVDKDALAEYHLSSQAITQALSSAGTLLAVGEIQQDGDELTVQSGQRLESVDDIAGLPVLGGFTIETSVENFQPVVTQEPVALTISDLADVQLVENPTDTISRVDGEPALALQITKKPTGNTVEVSQVVRDDLDGLAAKIGSNTQFTPVFDQAPSVTRSINSLLVEGLLGLGVALLVILVFLFSIRSTLVTAVSIPTSVLVTFIGVWAFGYSLNVLTLGALTISIGRVVDDSIVVIENIKRHLALGDDKLQAIKTGVREVATAVTASTLTTVAVFLPIAFVNDITGELFRPFAMTVTIALLASLFVSLTIVPVLAYWFLGSKPLTKRARARADEERRAVESGEDELDHPSRLQRGYLPVIGWTLRHPIVTVLAAVLVLVGSGAAVPLLQTNFIGSSGSNTLTVTQNVATGADLATKDAAATKVEKALLDVPGVETVQLTIGTANPLQAALGSGADATFSITTDENADQDTVTEDVRAAVAKLSDVGEVSVSSGQGGFTDSDIAIDIRAGDDASLAKASDAVLAAVRDLDVTAEATSNLAASRPYISIDVDRAAAADKGLTEVGVGRQVAAAMNPNASAQFELDGNQISIYLIDPDAPTTVDELKAFEIVTGTGETVALDEIADVALTDGPVSITTERGVQTAQVTVTPSTQDVTASGTAVTQALEDVELPPGASASVGGVVADQNSAFSQLGLAGLAAILIVYTIMVATFRSLRQPLLLLVSIPFAATGAIFLQLASGIPLGAASIIGLIMLVGIVVTNAIVLVDLVNQYRERGYRVAEAIRHGAARRLRPILMTALATIGALTPLALGLSGHGGFISQPLAITVIGGLVSSTLLTLVVLPTLYYLVEGAKERREDRRARKAGGSGEAGGSADPDGRGGPTGGSGGAGDEPDHGGSVPARALDHEPDGAPAS
ncbi:MAG: efflux RND transporter permease subunit [Actinomycetales bacterium]|nr:efflux RND transporter permease subunit [Actinomycetales bacterium]